MNESENWRVIEMQSKQALFLFVSCRDKTKQHANVKNYHYQVAMVTAKQYKQNCVKSSFNISQSLCAANMSENDNAWVFDSLICFLNGPIWNAPLQSFIEEKSLGNVKERCHFTRNYSLFLVFEPGVADENEYQKVFEEFKNLVRINCFFEA